MIKSKKNSEFYSWGDNCKAWQLVNSKDMSVIQEIMPPNSEEQLHFHTKTQQFFFVLAGKAEFTFGNEKAVVQSGSGIHIIKGQAHKVKNTTNKNLELLVISQPHSHLDRINLND